MDRPAWPWRLLAWTLFAVVGLTRLPALLIADVEDLVVHIIPSWIALGGLLAYAYGLRPRPLWFWRVFAPLFSLYTMASLGGELGRFLATFRSGPGPSDAYLFGLAMSVPLCFLTCIALLRHAQILRGRRRPAIRDLEGVFA